MPIAPHTHFHTHHCLIRPFLIAPFYYLLRPLPQMSTVSYSHCPLLRCFILLFSYMPIVLLIYCPVRPLLHTHIVGLALVNDLEIFFKLKFGFKTKAAFTLSNVSFELLLFTLDIRLRTFVSKPALNILLSFLASRLMMLSHRQEVSLMVANIAMCEPCIKVSYSPRNLFRSSSKK